MFFLLSLSLSFFCYGRKLLCHQSAQLCAAMHVWLTMQRGTENIPSGLFFKLDGFHTCNHPLRVQSNPSCRPPIPYFFNQVHLVCRVCIHPLHSNPRLMSSLPSNLPASSVVIVPLMCCLRRCRHLRYDRSIDLFHTCIHPSHPNPASVSLPILFPTLFRSPIYIHIHIYIYISPS